jgi:hypothetical protein
MLPVSNWAWRKGGRVKGEHACHTCAAPQDCDKAIALVQKAQADLLAAPGAATELELQAGMLGAAGTATAAEAASNGSVGTAAEAPPHSAAAAATAGRVTLPPQAAGATTSSDAPSAAGEDADSCQQSEPTQQQSVSDKPRPAASSEERPECQVAEQQVQDSGTACSTAGDVVCSTACSTAARLKQLLVKLLSRRAAARVELQQLQEAFEDLQHALR